ncbi:metallophosphoesterase family protein [Hydrogenimonas urashimensis]|uniref:metallophosphoesterase family protein n=1 Tax=Hydrogenimonas urashimensis TaxID=2740515 RepID=UPI0019168449|nr:YfcE family phosphodiesterase [Hydrogenimonas urashimensis]
MKLGILSDTHKKLGRARRAIDMLVENGAEFLIHAGDIGREETLAYMESIGLAYVAVLGNNDEKLAHLEDRYALFREPHYFDIGGLRVKLMHHPWFLSPDADLIVFGHTHKFSLECRLSGELFINPGEVCARNKPVSEAVLLELREDAWHIVHCERRIKESEWRYNRHICSRKVPADV